LKMELEELLKKDNLIIMGSHEYPGIDRIQFWGGIGEVVRNISERLVKRSWEVLVLPRLITEYRTSAPIYLEHNGVHILGLEMQRYLAGKENADLYLTHPGYEGTTTLDHAYTTWRFLEKHGLKNAILHVHDWLGVGWAREGKRKDFKTILSVHMSVGRDAGQVLVDKRLELERLSGQYSKAIHYVSFDTFKSCRIYGWNSNKKQLVIPNGVDIEKFTPLKEKSPEEYVLFVGRLVPVKNVPVLLEGWSRFNDKYPEVKLQILGAPGASYIDVVNAFNALPPEKKMKIELRTAMVPFEERVKRIQNASVFCAPSSKEAFGIVAVEAQSCGVPVVVGDVGGFKENVLEGITGAHVDGTNPDSIAEGLELAYLNRKEFGKNGRRLVEGYFNWDKIIEKYITELYEGNE